ncbi:MAG: hypothetical protein J2P52_13460 [Blastocatellia bacterium]|nr:hypothetical protein [Blastocatellia bacterium]
MPNLILRIFFAFLVINAGCAYKSSAPKPQTAGNQAVPPTPARREDRFGVYNWDVNDSAFPRDGSIDLLNWGANKVAETGSRTIRVFIGTLDIKHVYDVNPPGATELVQIAKSPAYDKLFHDPRFQTYLLTAYSTGDVGANWVDGYTDSEYGAERDEIKKLGEYMLGNPAFAGKTFIILNWEGDNALDGLSNRRSVWDHYTRWIRARAEGVKLAKRNYPSSGARLFSGLEFNAIKSLGSKKTVFCGTPVADPINEDPLQNRCVIDYVAPQVDVDYYSYSAWDSVNDKQASPDEDLKRRFKNDLGFALSKVKASRPRVTERNFIIGEFGFERTRHGECNAANYLSEFFDAFDGDGSFGVSYAIFWQIIDNRRIYAPVDERFGLFRATGGRLEPTLLSETFRKKIAGEQASKYTGCPRIRLEPAGVVNLQGAADFRLNPDAVISIHAPGGGSTFSVSGNTVSFHQAARDFKLPLDNKAPGKAPNKASWSESPGQIRFSIPAARRPGPVWLYVTDARGIDSDARTIELSCDDCPQIDGSCGALNAADPMLAIEPGSVIAIKGAKFSPSGNRVVIETLGPGQITRSLTLPRKNILSESTTRITAKLPNDLPQTYKATVHVINRQGLESRETPIVIAYSCKGCIPRWRPCQAIANESATEGGGDYLAGAPMSLFGLFSPTGNKVVVEQTDRNYQVHQNTIVAGAAGWSESDNHIRFALPATLFPGRALLYVIDAQDHETATGIEIKIK